jgi:hypothetical protein
MIIVRIILIILVVITAGLYLRVLMPPEEAAKPTAQPVVAEIPAETPAPVHETTLPAPTQAPALPAESLSVSQATPADVEEKTKMKPLPEDQMQ